MDQQLCRTMVVRFFGIKCVVHINFHSQYTNQKKRKKILVKYVCKFQGDNLRTYNLLTFCVRECNFPHFHDMYSNLKMRYLVDASVCFYVFMFEFFVFIDNFSCRFALSLCNAYFIYIYFWHIYIFSTF